MGQDQSIKREPDDAATPPPLPPPAASAATAPPRPEPPRSEPPRSEPTPGDEPPARRVARRRPAGPVRNRVAANDDAPSIGGLIYALEQKPSTQPFRYAAIASGVWAVLGLAFIWFHAASELSGGIRFAELMARPSTYMVLTALVVPIAVVWFLSLLAWRAEELRLRSSTMTEVAIRLAEPDRMAEQSIASLGQAVRRQVSFMNDAVSRALGRAGELEALVHNEVSALERSYEENERKIRGLIQELSGERHALLSTSERVTDTLRTLGTEVPQIIDRLSGQQAKLAQIMQGAGENLITLETSLAGSAGRLENSLENQTRQLQVTFDSRAAQLQGVLETFTGALGGALENRTDQMQAMLQDYTGALAAALGSRSDQMQTVFEEYVKVLDSQLVERTKYLGAAFEERLKLFDDSINRSTLLIDQSVGEKTTAITTALDSHARAFGETITRQSADLDQALMHGINAVRRSSENITRQSLKAIEGLASQSDLLKNVTENLLGQVNSVANRFETQGQTIMRAANALESANYKIDITLQTRHNELTATLTQLSGKADELGTFLSGYSHTLEGTLSDANSRAKALADEMKAGAQNEGERALEDLRRRFSNVSTEVTEQLGSLTSRFDETTEAVRARAARAAAEIADEQARIRQQMDALPATTRESAESMRRALQDQLKALDQLSSLTRRTASERDVSPPISPMPPPAPGHMTSGALVPMSGVTPPPRPASPDRSITSLSSTLAGELSRQRAQQGVDPRDSWKLGDLLARASLDDGHAPAAQAPPPLMPPPVPGVPAVAAPPAPPATSPFALDVGVLARALDAPTASAIWTRFRAGQRGIMVRSIYSTDGRSAFDEVTRRCKSDAQFAGMIGRYLADFERLIAETDARDPTGRTTHGHLVSDSGRVYLFLAHASGRLA